MAEKKPAQDPAKAAFLAALEKKKQKGASHAESHADNPFAVAAPGAKGEPGYLLTHQRKSFDWRERNARPHPLSTGHTKLLAAALKRFDAVFWSLRPLIKESNV